MATCLIPYDEDQARKVAEVVGDSSAHALALKELDRRRKAGEDVRLWWSSSTIVVSPIPEQAIKNGEAE